MVSKLFWAMALTLGLNNVFANDGYRWRQCQSGSAGNLYNSDLEVENIFGNDTIKMDNYAGQVINK